MSADRQRHRLPRGAHGSPVQRDDGSAVVIALALAAVVLIVMASASARVLSATSGAAGSLAREQARTSAEYSLMLALAQLDAGGAAQAVRGGTAVDQTLLEELPAQGGSGPGTAIVSVRITSDDPREQLHVRSEAVVGTARHVATATVRSLLSVDHLHLTEYEVVDPALLRLQRAACSAPRGHPRRDPDCIASVLGPGVFDGPVHSNDALVLAPGTAFASELTTSHVAPGPDGSVGPVLWDAALDATGGATGDAPFGLSHQSELELPREAREVLVGVPVTCRFRGPTLLRFDGPRVRITSPRSIPRAEDPAPGTEVTATAPDAIGCLGIDRAALAGVVVVELPDTAVIEVVRDLDADCVDHPLGLAVDEDLDREWWCSDGDAFVWGRYRGARTVVAQDHIQILWDLEPGDAAAAGAPAGGDMLGLVAGDSVVLRRPVGRPERRGALYGPNLAFAGAHVAPFGAYPLDAPNAVATTWDSPRIVAALVALRGGISIQNPFRGETHPGPLRVEGALASRFRGVLAWEERNASGSLLATMGYPVELTYDRRFAMFAPPAMPLTAGGAIRILELDVG